MRKTSDLITSARAISRNGANADGTFSIGDNEVLQYLNDAQDRIQNLICSKKNIAKIFAAEVVISIVANQEAYSVPDRVLLNKQIEDVQFSADGTAANYVSLIKLDLFNRDTNTSSYPYGYIKRGNKLYIQPKPAVAGGTLRIVYERDIDDLDISRGAVSSIGSGTSTQFATLTLDSAANSYETTTPGWSNIQYFCVTSPTGTRRTINVLMGSYNTGTNVVTPSPSPWPYATVAPSFYEDSQIVAGDICTFGKYTTIFSQLPDNCERYLIHYAASELLRKDSSEDYRRAEDRLAQMEEDILDALAAQTAEVQYIPQHNKWEW